MSPTNIESMMKSFHEELGPEKLKWLMSNFDGTKTLRDMFTFLWDFESAHKHLLPVLLPSGKSQEDALDFQAEGDEFLAEKCYSEALEKYNRSIMNAPHPSVSSKGYSRKESATQQQLLTAGDWSALAAGYAKRSYALFNLRLIEQCLNDIEMALVLGYSDNKINLEKLKVKCMNLRNNNYKNFNGEDNIPENFDSLLKISSTTRVPQITPAVANPHPTFPSLSDALRVVCSPEKGKHVLSERDIYPGEIVGVERSCCSSLDLANLSSHCSTCLMKCQVPVPCPDCAMVAFCSDACREKGLSGDHWLECRLLPSMEPLFGIALKLFQCYSCKQLQDIMKNLQDETKDCPYGINDFCKSETDNSNVIRAINHLVTNKDMRPSGDLYVKCLIAFLMTKLLIQSGRFFVNSCGESEAPTQEDISFTGQMLFSNLLKISCNGFKHVEFECSGPYSEMEKINVGSGIFPVLCLFNHSCYGNVEPYSYGRIQILRALRFIPAGSEVTEGYIRGFYLQPKEYRQKYLLNIYQFQCVCEACKANWPTFHDLPGTLQFSCLDCHQPVSESAPVCMKCFLDYERKDYEPSKQTLVDKWCSDARGVREAFGKSQEVAVKMMNGKHATEREFSDICQAITLMEKYVPFPCQPVWDAHDALDLYFHRGKEDILTNAKSNGEK